MNSGSDWPDFGESWDLEAGPAVESTAAGPVWPAARSTSELAEVHQQRQQPSSTSPNENSLSEPQLPDDDDVIERDQAAADEPVSGASVAVSADRVARVWTSRDLLQLRRSLSVCGSLAGCVSGAPRQPRCLGLPAMLMPEEVWLCAAASASCRFSICDVTRAVDPACLASLHQLERRRIVEQQEYMVHVRKKQILDRATSIVDGKMRRLRRDQCDASPAKRSCVSHQHEQASEMIERLMATVSAPAVKQCYQQLYRQCPVSSVCRPVSLPHSTLSSGNSEESCGDKELSDILARCEDDGGRLSCRAAVFVDLWRRGYMLTDGLKFGCDLLAYCGDPLVCHAALLVVCCDRPVSVLQTAAVQRLARSCCKTAVLSRVSACGRHVQHVLFSRTGLQLARYCRNLPRDLPST